MFHDSTFRVSLIPWILVLVLGGSLPWHRLAAAGDEGKNAACFRCHALPTLAVREDTTGVHRSFFVDPRRFAHSNHKSLECVHCHTQGFTTYPHGTESPVSSLACTSCHTNDPKFATLRFPEIEGEFRRSVHAQRLGDRMTCFSCHDPHAFDRQPDPSLTKIQTDNRICMQCHLSEARFASLTGRRFPVLEEVHAWLPNTAMHWEKVRCVDCHSSYAAPNLSHNILSKDQAVRNCESCHSANTILRSKLYAHQAREERQKFGFINGSLMNNAYVIGSTRNAWLDVLSMSIFGLLFGGIGLHAFLRWRGTRARRSA